MKLITRFELASRRDSELHTQQRERFLRWTIWLAVIWIILIDEGREREHKRRFATQQELHHQDKERRRRKRRKHPAPKTPTP